MSVYQLLTSFFNLLRTALVPFLAYFQGRKEGSLREKHKSATAAVQSAKARADIDDRIDSASDDELQQLRDKYNNNQ